MCYTHTMPAYFVAEIDVHDATAYEPYRPLAAAAIAAHGGRYLVRGGAAELIEGEGEPKRIVVLEFPDVEAARRWYNSPDYQAALPLRLSAASGRALLVQGVE